MLNSKGANSEPVCGGSRRCGTLFFWNTLQVWKLGADG